jgi:ABC-type multidrug transport system fused ATPase/permease subunit
MEHSSSESPQRDTSDQFSAAKPPSEMAGISNISDDKTEVPTPSSLLVPAAEEKIPDPLEASSSENSPIDSASAKGGYEPIKTQSHTSRRPNMASRKLSEEEIFRVISRRPTNTSGRRGSFLSVHSQEEQAEIERLMSRIFGKNRQEQSEDEKTRHVGVVFKHLTVKGMGLGAALQPTIGDPFLALPRLVQGLFAGKGRGAAGKPPTRTIIDDFSGCIRPGEMLLVLGRPGAGCSTFLKVLANQRFGFTSVEGEVAYGGTDAKIMAKDYRGEVVYNPEDDLHYATLSVKRTLEFALKTRTPGKASRNEGESRKDYVREFLRVVAKLFWIEHTVSGSGICP